MDVTLHQRAAVVVLNIAFPAVLRHLVLLGEALLFKIADCEVICISQQILRARGLHVFLQLIHEPGPVSLDLLIRSDSKEGYFGEFLLKVLSVANPANDIPFVFQDNHRFVIAIKD